MTPDLEAISERLYGLTCKQYKFEAPQVRLTHNIMNIHAKVHQLQSINSI